MIETTGKRDDLSAKLGDEAAKKKKIDRVCRKTIYAKGKFILGFFKTGDLTKTTSNKILNY